MKNGVGRRVLWTEMMWWVGGWHRQENAIEGRCCKERDLIDSGMLSAGNAIAEERHGQGRCWAGDAVSGAAHGRYLWSPPSRQSRRRYPQARYSAQVGGRSGPRVCSESLACSERNSGMWCQPGQPWGTRRTGTQCSPHQLQHHQLGLGGAADDPCDGDGLQVWVPRARVLEERPQVHLVAREVGITAGWGCEDTGGSHHPTPQPRPYQEEKHCRVLITHCSFTRDPPQKCTPALWGWGSAPGGHWLCGRELGSHSPVANADSPGRVARLATNNAPFQLQPLIPLATLLKRHCVCGHGGCQMGPCHWHLPHGSHPAPVGPNLHSPGQRALGCQLWRESTGWHYSRVQPSWGDQNHPRG